MKTNISASELRRAADIKDRIDELQGVLQSIFGVADQPEPAVPQKSGWTDERRRKFKRTMAARRKVNRG